MGDRLTDALAAWEAFGWTNALLTVSGDTISGDSISGDTVSGDTVSGDLVGDLYSVKDVYATRGVRSTAGSLLFAAHVPGEDAEIVTRLRSAGAVMFGKANCAEFEFGTDTETRVGGRVMHPWDPGLSPGGSSGGDAVAVATGIVDFGIGGDYGGSVRWPAQAVGVFGLRTGVGTVPRTGTFPGWDGLSSGVTSAPNPWTLKGQLSTVGVFARTPAKIVEVLGVLSGPDGQDWLGLGQALSSGPKDLVPRIAVTAASEVAPSNFAVGAALAAVTGRAQAIGFEVVDPGPVLAGANETYSALRSLLDHHAEIRSLVDGQENLLCDETCEVLRVSCPGGDRLHDAARLATLWADAQAVRQAVRSLLEGVCALVLPVAPCGPLPFAGSTIVDGKRLAGHGLMAHCRAVSLTGLPSLAVPVGDRRHPVSVQIVAPAGEEQRCCHLAEVLFPSEESG